MVKHILKDGREVKDISGHIVPEKDFPSIYKYLRRHT